MKLLPKSEFPRVTRSTEEKFSLWLAESNARFRAGAWTIALIWTVIAVTLKPEVPAIILIFCTAAWGAVVMAHLSHGLLSVLRRANEDKPACVRVCGEPDNAK